MRVCFIVSEYFRWGQFGGYGTITRAVAEGLARRGHEVSALVTRRSPQAKREQRDVESIDGVNVIAVPHSYLQRWLRRGLYRLPQAELYVSIDARFDSWMARRQNPRARHCIWLIDPMSFDEFWNLHADDGGPGKLISRLVFETLQAFGRRAARRADALLSQTRRMVREGAAFYGAAGPVRFAPNAIPVPEAPIAKARRPLILFLGRFDRQKQPEEFFRLAASRPDLRFVAAGAATDPARDRELRRRYGGLANLELPGVVTGERKDRLLRRAWILCNTSLREGLPMSFQEALAYGCALLAAVDPDELVSRFGYHAGDRAFERGLDQLLEAGRWRKLGEAGREHVLETYSTERALDAHETIYREILAGGGAAGRGQGDGA